jgi:uncharacterized protein YndB with AHSA1/START domain
MGHLDRLGTFKQQGDRFELRFERHYPHPIEAVWSALTDPKRLEDWMGSADVEPRIGGRFDLMVNDSQPSTGRITVWEPPSVLEFRWSNASARDAVARYELTRDGDGTQMLFIHEGIPNASRALMLPGWHFRFLRLSTALNGRTKPRSTPSYRELQLLYIDNYKLTDPTLGSCKSTD